MAAGVDLASVAFHFPSLQKSREIVVNGLRESKAGWLGPGVYAGTIPCPHVLVKTLLWGLWRRPVRIPIVGIDCRRIRKTGFQFPPYSVVVRRSDFPDQPLFRMCPTEMMNELRTS